MFSMLIKSNDIKENSDRGIFVSGSTANDGIIEDNTVINNTWKGIIIQHSDGYYLGNNTISAAGGFDIQFFKTTVGNKGKGNTFSTISIDQNANFVRYNYLTLEFMQDESTGFSDQIKLVNDGSTKYSTSYYGGSDSKNILPVKYQGLLILNLPNIMEVQRQCILILIFPIIMVLGQKMLPLI